MNKTKATGQHSSCEMNKNPSDDILTGFPDVLCVEDIISILRCSRTVAYRMVRSGEIKTFTVGKSYRILKSELINYMRRAS